MTQIHLPDVDALTGMSSASVPVFHEFADISHSQWADLTRDVWYTQPLREKHGFDRVQAHLWATGDWFLSESQMPGMLVQVESCHLQDIGSHINFERTYLGNWHYLFDDGESFKGRLGTIECFDRARPYKCVSSSERAQIVSLPRAEIDLPSNTAASVPSMTDATAIGKILLSEWDDLFDTLKQERGTLSTVKRERFAACLKIALGANPQREDVRVHARQALFRQICLFIERNLEQLDLSSATLLDQFGVSRATLYRMFEPLGGVRNYLTYRRATSALFDLSEAQAERGATQRVCDRWGFSSPANFNRTVQRLFGNSPRALVGRDTASTAGDTTDFGQTYIATVYDLDSRDGLALAAA